MKKSIRFILTACLALCIMQCRLAGTNNDSQKNPDDPKVIAAPSGLSASAASSEQINLTWTDNSDNETGFEIAQTVGGVTKTITVAANATSYSDTGLAASTEYTYKIRAVDEDEYSDYSDEAKATTQATPIVKPAAPSDLTATAISTNRIDLSWMVNSTIES